ncbi:MAG: hypothetical protein M3036_05900, partial [Bifidobacteriales bacterium]|nr:hypothetical protein [Bifidobacteriales bacterium]
LFALERFARDDVRMVHGDAPLCSGFEGILHPWKGQLHALTGTWRCALVNIIGEVFSMVVTDLVVHMADGRCQSVQRKEPKVQHVERVRALVSELADQQPSL